MLILNPTLRKYRTKPKRQGYLQKALLQVGKVKVNFDVDDITKNYGQKESSVDEKITGSDVEMLEIEQVNNDKDKTEIVPHAPPEKDIVESNHSSDNESRLGSIVVSTDDPLERRESCSPGKVKNDLEKIPLLNDSEKNYDTVNNSQAPLEQKREDFQDSQESNNSSGAVKGTLSGLNNTVETSAVNSDDTAL